MMLKNKFVLKNMIKIVGVITLLAACIIMPMKADAAEKSKASGELHAFYPANASFTDQTRKYIDDVDSVSFAWSRIYAQEPQNLNTVKGKNGNYGFYYPSDYIQPVAYAKSKGKSVQLNIYMGGSDSIALLPYEDKRQLMIKAIIDTMQADISQGEGLFYDGVVIDFEGLKDTDSNGTQVSYEGEPISAHFIQFLTELKSQLDVISKKMYVAVNPGVYYDGYDYAGILNVSDRVILMAHDYEPVGKLQKNQVQQYTGYNALMPVNSMAPLPMVRQALNEMVDAAENAAELSKVWLQITFDSAQWRFDVKDAKSWDLLSATALSRDDRLTPLYQSIKARVDNTDGKGQNIMYGYNNELQTPCLQYFNSSDQSWNVILYEDSNSISAKIDLAKVYGLGGISIWSLANVPDYTDTNGRKYHLDGWSTVIKEMAVYHELPKESSQYVTFTDKTVEKAVRDKLGITNGKLSVYDVKGIYRLKLPQGVKSLKDLKYLVNLEYLDAQQLGIKTVSEIGGLKNLRVLYLQRNQITDITALKKLTNLQVLSLNGNQISSISALSSLKKLQELYLRENKIVTITGLAGLTALRVLEIGDNSISKIDAVKNLKSLSQLALDNNKISDITAVKNLTGLKALYLQRNQITGISPLSGLKGLTLLSLNGNRISELKDLSKLTALEKLYLKENRITNVTALKGLTKLKELYLGSNKITNYSPLKSLYAKSGFLCDFTILS